MMALQNEMEVEGDEQQQPNGELDFDHMAQ